MAALAAAAPALWPLAARPAELLASVDLVDSGAILGCIYADASSGYRLACIEARRYVEFDVRCEFDADASFKMSPGFHSDGFLRYRFVCPVTAERSVGGNALQLDCATIRRSLENELRYKMAVPNPPKQRFLLEGHIVPTMSCTAVKVDLPSHDTGGASR